MEKQKQKRRLKPVIYLLFLPILLLLLISNAHGAQDHREVRIATEEAEKEWVNSLVRSVKVDGAATPENFTEDLRDTTVHTNKKEEDEVTDPRLLAQKEKITCHHYNANDCRTKGECDIVVKECARANHLAIVGCMAVFEKPSDDNETIPWHQLHVVPKSKLVVMDCMMFQSLNGSNCDDVHQCRQNGNFHGKSSGFCCCMKSGCNVEGNIFGWQRDPPEVVANTTTVAPVVVVTDEGIGFLWIALAVAIFLGLLVLVIFTVWKCRRDKTGVIVVKDGEAAKEDNGKTPLVDKSVMLEMQPTKTFLCSDYKLVSLGRFGSVYRAKWKDPVTEAERFVAVKKLIQSEKNNYEAEKKIFETLKGLPRWYPSIVGYVDAEKIGDEYWVITEFVERLSLHDLLNRNVISISAANRIILTMVDGLQFLHDDRPYYFKHQKPPIIHRDIKSKNILVKADMTACIADFGLARIYGESLAKSDLLTQVGTRRYMSPEMLESSTEYAPNAFRAMDVYSMGLVCWEVISRTKLSISDEVPKYEPPYENLGYNPSIGTVRSHVVTEKKRPTWRQEVMDHEYMSQMARLTEEMWEPEAYARITAGYAFARFWELVIGWAETSEGYHSNEDGQALLDEDGIPKCVDDTIPMMEYHMSDGKLRHPSSDPADDLEIPVPPIPDLDNYKPVQEEGALEQAALDEANQDQVYNVNLKMVQTRKEFERMRNEQVENEVEPPAPRCPSTPTPSHFGGDDTFKMDLSFSKD